MKLSNVVGLVLAAFGGLMLATCAVNWAHCNALIAGMGCGLLTLGALIFDPDTVLTALKSLAGIAGPYIPTGGRRFTDPVERPYNAPKDDEGAK